MLKSLIRSFLIYMAAVSAGIMLAQWWETGAFVFFNPEYRGGVYGALLAAVFCSAYDFYRNEKRK